MKVFWFAVIFVCVTQVNSLKCIFLDFSLLFTSELHNHFFFNIYQASSRAKTDNNKRPPDSCPRLTDAKLERYQIRFKLIRGISSQALNDILSVITEFRQNCAVVKLFSGVSSTFEKCDHLQFAQFEYRFIILFRLKNCSGKIYEHELL